MNYSAKKERYTIEIQHQENAKLFLYLREVVSRKKDDKACENGNKTRSTSIEVGHDSPAIIVAMQLKIILENAVNGCRILNNPTNNFTQYNISLSNLLLGKDLDFDRFIDSYEGYALATVKKTNAMMKDFDRKKFVFHRDILKAILIGAIQGSDEVESFQCFCDSLIPSKPTKSTNMHSLMDKDLKDSKFRLSITKSNYKRIRISDLDNPLDTFLKILSNPMYFPISITFIREQTPRRKMGNLNRTVNILNAEMDAKRQKVNTIGNISNYVKVVAASDSASRGMNNDEPICLLDSSSDEDNEYSKCDKEVETRQEAIVIDDDLLSFTIAKPDPYVEYFEGDFVYTPYGPGRILYHYIRRNCNVLMDSEGGHLNSCAICVIQYPFAIGFIESSLVYNLSSFSTSPTQKYSHKRSPKLNDVKRIEHLGRQFAKKQVLYYEGVSLTEMDRLRLWPSIYLNDSIINFYLKYLLNRHKQKEHKCPITITSERDNSNDKKHESSDKVDKFFVFPTYFFTHLSNLETQDGNNPSSFNGPKGRKGLWAKLKVWTKGVDIFKMKYLIIPVNYKMHWTSVLVCNPDRISKMDFYLYGQKGSKNITNGFDRFEREDKLKDCQSFNMCLNGDASLSIEKEPSSKMIHSTRAESRGVTDSKLLDFPKLLTSINVEETFKSEDNPDSFESFANMNATGFRLDTELFLDNENESNSTVTEYLNTKSSENHSVKTESNNKKLYPRKDETMTDSNQKVSLQNSQYISNIDSDYLKKSNIPNGPYPCMLHLDSGKHFKLHQPKIIFRYIRKFLTAAYEAKQPDYSLKQSFNIKTLPGYSPDILTQENTKDCGVYMIETIERVLKHPPIIYSSILCRKGQSKCSLNSELNLIRSERFGHDLANKKRNEMLALIYNLNHELKT